MSFSTSSTTVSGDAATRSPSTTDESRASLVSQASIHQRLKNTSTAVDALLRPTCHWVRTKDVAVVSTVPVYRQYRPYRRYNSRSRSRSRSRSPYFRRSWNRRLASYIFRRPILTIVIVLSFAANLHAAFSFLSPLFARQPTPPSMSPSMIVSSPPTMSQVVVFPVIPSPHINTETTYQRPVTIGAARPSGRG